MPVVIAGGKKLPEIDALKMAHGAISDGAVGVDMGRNIFQSDSPVGIIQAVRAIVHDGKSVLQTPSVKRKSGHRTRIRRMARIRADYPCKSA